VPFLDPEVLEAAAPLVANEKLASGTTKWALRAAVAPLVPPPVASRPKAGFPLPMGRWLRGELADLVDEVVEEAQVDEHLRRDAVRAVVRRHRSGEDDDWRPVWVLVCFALWHQVVVERRYDPVALGWMPSAVGSV
jgi:asparagine synthase (glutamine-hydrolysing)